MSNEDLSQEEVELKENVKRWRNIVLGIYLLLFIGVIISVLYYIDTKKPDCISNPDANECFCLKSEWVRDVECDKKPMYYSNGSLKDKFNYTCKTREPILKCATARNRELKEYSCEELGYNLLQGNDFCSYKKKWVKEEGCLFGRSTKEDVEKIIKQKNCAYDVKKEDYQLEIEQIEEELKREER